MKNKNLQGSILTDERTQTVTSQSLAGAGVVAVLYAVGMIFYKGFTDQNFLPELALLVVMVLVIFIVNRKNHVYEIPKTFTGKPVDIALTKKGKWNRVKFYVLDSLFFPIAYVLIQSLIDKEVNLINGVTEFGICFAVFFLLDYLAGEHQVKAYHRYMDSICEEEEEQE